MVLIARNGFKWVDVPVLHPELITFGHTVRRLRRARKLSQEELGFAAGLDRSYVGGVERGERNLSLLNLVRLARGLGLSLAELLKDFEDGGQTEQEEGVRSPSPDAGQAPEGGA
jgi:transcriptional regulator with XRE-family HTH domain